MKVLLKYRLNDKIIEEIVELIEGEVTGYAKEIPIGIKIPALENHTMFEDDEGLFSLPNEDIIEIKRFNNIPKFSDN